MLDLGGPRQLAAPAILVAVQGRVVPADVLADRICQGRPPASAATTVQGPQGKVGTSLAELERLLSGPSVPPGEVRGGYLFDLVVEDGVVVELRHVYLV